MSLRDLGVLIALRQVWAGDPVMALVVLMRRAAP
jgi:hypothetical protein